MTELPDVGPGFDIVGGVGEPKRGVHEEFHRDEIEEYPRAGVDPRQGPPEGRRGPELPLFAFFPAASPFGRLCSRAAPFTPADREEAPFPAASPAGGSGGFDSGGRYLA